jgi:uncharacterized protein
MKTISARLAAELAVDERRVVSAVELLDAGSTVPFIARYRKEATGELDDAQLRLLEERLRYLRELDERRNAVLESIRTQGKLVAELERQLYEAETKARLEDIYLPFKPKRRNKALIAIEAGLAPLLDRLLDSSELDPVEQAADFIDAAKGVESAQQALDGARAIFVERLAEDPALVGMLRERFWTTGRLASRVRDGKQSSGARFSDYFDWSEPFTKMPSHRILALFRGESEETLDLSFESEPIGATPARGTPSSYELAMAASSKFHNRGGPGDGWIAESIRWAWRTRISVRLAVDIRMRLMQFAEDEAVKVFASSLRAVLLAAPAGPRATLGLDPGFRTGVKVAVVDATGKVVATDTIYPHEPQKRWGPALASLERLCQTHGVELVAIGNGTASRETDKLATDLLARRPDLKLTKAMVSEAGASVYSASAYASQELPELDVTLRGAVSIARRLQDPLAELVKIDPKSIGVGQYQHDIAEAKLSRALDAVVEDCVNAVGVEVNTASAPLLARVSGLNESLARAVVERRDETGGFRSRDDLKKVPRLGPRAFEQCAGFLRIRDGADPIDATGVHPESYPLVRRILAHTKKDIRTLMGDAGILHGLKPEIFADATFGAPTVSDVLDELQKPGRDPRPAFKTASFTDGVETIDQLRPGMILEGVVTNVAAFGAFVDIGVHRDGLVHISALSETFVKDPRAVVGPGDIVKVKVLDIDKPRNRINLSMRMSDEPGVAGPASRGGPPPSRRVAESQPREPTSSTGGALADALRNAGLGRAPPRPQ